MRINEPAHGNGLRVLRVSESKSPHSLEATSPNRECDSSVSPRIVGYSLINRHLLSPSKLLRDQDYELKGNGRHWTGMSQLQTRIISAISARRSALSHRHSESSLVGYRLLNMSVVFSFGLTKAMLTYMDRSAMPTTLDWVSGVCLAVM